MPRKVKVAETMDSKVLVISKHSFYKIQLKLLLDQSPYLEGICYPPISKIHFKEFNDGIIKKVLEFCRTQKILSGATDDETEELLKFAEQTKMDKLKDYILHPKIEPQGDFLPLPSSTNEISDVEDTENEDEKNDQSVPIYYINAINIKPSAEKDESNNEEQIKPQSYIPQDPLLHPGPEEIFSPMRFKPQIIIPSPPPPQQIKDRSLSLTPSTADEAEEGILGERVYESATFVPEENLAFKPIPAEAVANENSAKTLLQRIRSFFS